ncbi:hypothetical protein Hanom_Chr12g01139321 [Helianthus anomalus]
MFMRGDRVMPALDFIKCDDTSDIVLGDSEAVKGEDAIATTAEGRLVPGGKYVNILNVKGFTKDQGVEAEVKKDKELSVVVRKKGKSEGKKVVVSTARGSSGKSGEGSSEVNAGEVYVLNWNVKVGDNFKSSAVCEDVLNNFPPPMVRGQLTIPLAPSLHQHHLRRLAQHYLQYQG